VSPKDDDQVGGLPGYPEDESTQQGLKATPVPGSIDLRLARLVVLSGGQVGRKYVLGAEAVIGRSSEATIIVDDAQVSRRHAVIRPLHSGGFVVEDLKSRNGTTVNGIPIDRHELRFGDRIQIGGHTLLFTHQDPLQDQILQRQKLEAIGRLGAGIAHDFNNLLGAAVSTLDYVEALPEDRTLADPEVRECLADVRSATTRATELTRRLLGFSRRGLAEHTVVDVSSLCADVMHLLRRTFDQSIELRGDIKPRLAIHGHQGELHQLLMNLCINARDAMPGGGTLSLEADTGEPEKFSDVPLTSPDPHVVITIRDTGIGMDEDTRRHVFEPFFTTKEREAGAGLGLATVFEVATGHGGTVTVDSAAGEGTTFSVYLPAAEAGSAPQRAFRTTQRRLSAVVDEATRTGRILVVDDQKLVRRSLGRLLRLAGHTVTFAKHGKEALEHFEPGAERPELVLLDLDMPELDGVATLAKMREIDKDVRVICVSGHWDEPRERELRAMNVIELVEKPYAARDLLQLVSNSL